MDIQTLDFFFPFFVFAYGALVTIALNIPALEKIANEKFPQELLAQLRGHRFLAGICLLIGTVWSLQNLWNGQAPLF